MDILHYVNVLIGFSLVMLVLSSVVGSTAQAMMIIFQTKTRAVGNGLVNLLLEFELTKDDAVAQLPQYDRERRWREDAFPGTFLSNPKTKGLITLRKVHEITLTAPSPF